MLKFDELVDFYNKVKIIMSSICVQKGGIDIENYSGRFFLADFLDFIVAYGDKVKANTKDLKKELETKKDLLTPSVKPIHEMTKEEFDKILGVRAGDE